MPRNHVTDRLDEIEARLKGAPRFSTYVPEFDKSRWGQDVVRVTRCRDNPWTTLEFMPNLNGDTPYAEMLAHAGEDLIWLLTRVRELEAGLLKFGQHGSGCWYLPRAAIEGGDTEPCTCGLAALTGG